MPLSIVRMNSSIQWCCKTSVRVRLICNSSIGIISTASNRSLDFIVFVISICKVSISSDLMSKEKSQYVIIFHYLCGHFINYVEYKHKLPKCRVHVENF